MVADKHATERIQGYCALCISRCGSIAVVEDGRFVALDPTRSHPTGKALCAKGRAAPELVYHPDRLLYPLKRTRPKGDPDPGWQRISWDEALDLTAADLRRIAEEHGPESVVFSVRLALDLRVRRLDCLDHPADERVRQPEPVRRDGAVRLGAAPGHAVHLRRGGARRVHARPRECRLHSLLGLQPEPRPPQPRDRHHGGAQTRRAPDRGRPAADRHRQEGGRLAAGAAGHRRGAGAGHRRRDDRTRLVRSRVHPRLDERPAAGARGQRPLADRGRPVGEGSDAAATWPGARRSGRPVIYDPATGAYEGGAAELALFGAFEVETAQGRVTLPAGLRA